MANNHENLPALFTDIADAIREKAGTTDPIVADAFPEAISMIETGGGGGDTSVESTIITKEISGQYTNNRVKIIGSYAFAFCSRLTSINFPAVDRIYDGAFSGCSNLTSVSFPAATWIGARAFQYCYSLPTASFLLVRSIGTDAFLHCSNLTTASFPAATYLSNSAFCSCSNLTTTNFPAVSIIGNGVFVGCTKLTTISFPAATNILRSAFWKCSNLTTLYLMGSLQCLLSSTNAFLSAGITSSTGSIYVPTSLLTSYQTATNWTYFSTRFVAGD